MAIQTIWPFNQQKAGEAGGIPLEQGYPTIGFAIKRVVVKVDDGKPGIRRSVSACENALHVA
jgi:hypothetical protein